MKAKITPYLLLIIVVLGSIVIFSTYSKKYAEAVSKYNTTIDSIKYNNTNLGILNITLNDSISRMNVIINENDSILRINRKSLNLLKIKLDSVKIKLDSNSFGDDSTILSNYLGKALLIRGKFIQIDSMQLKKINYSIIKNSMSDSIILKQSISIKYLKNNQILLTRTLLLKDAQLHNDSTEMSNYKNIININTKKHNKEIRRLKRKVVVRTIVGAAAVTIITIVAILAH